MVERAPRTQDKFIIRLPDGMRDQIRAAAAASGKTMTAEIVARLQSTFDARTSGASGNYEHRIDGLEAALEQIQFQLTTLRNDVRKV